MGSILFDGITDPLSLISQLINTLTLPAGGVLLCILAFFLTSRKRGRLLFSALSLSVSLNLILKALFRVQPAWLDHPERAPFLAEAGYTLPCSHTQLAAALLWVFALTTNKKPVRFLCAIGIFAAPAVRLLSGAQSVPDVLTALATGIFTAWLIVRTASGSRKEWMIIAAAALCGAAALFSFENPWAAGTAMTAAALLLMEKLFVRTEWRMGFFWKALETVLGCGCYIGLYVLLPFLIEWLITPFLPGQVLTVFLISFLPCLFRLFG